MYGDRRETLQYLPPTWHPSTSAGENTIRGTSKANLKKRLYRESISYMRYICNGDFCGNQCCPQIHEGGERPQRPRPAVDKDLGFT